MTGRADLGALLRDYRAALVRRNYAAGTIRMRIAVARRYLEHTGDAWPVATWQTIEAYGQTRRIGPSTWRDEVSHLSTFYRWAVRSNLARVNPAELVDRPRLPSRLPRPAADHDYHRLIDGASALELAIVELMAWCGLRCIEVAHLRTADLDFVHHVARVRGKGDRERVVALPGAVVRALAAIDSGDEHAVIGARGLPLSSARVSQIVTARARAAGLTITAHQLRHRFATQLLEACGRLEVVQHALGHKSISTTQIYAEVDRREVLAAMRGMWGSDAPTLF